MKIFEVIQKTLLTIKTFLFVFIKIVKTSKKNIIFLEGGFGVISTHCYSVPFIFNKKQSLVFWLVKSELNPIEMINMWKKRVDIIPINIFKINTNFLNLNIKKILLYFWKMISKILGKNFYDIWNFDILFYNRYSIKKFELLERKNKNFSPSGFNFHNEENVKKYQIFRSPFLSQIVKGEKSKKPLLEFNKLILKYLLDLENSNKNFYMLYVRKRNISSLEGKARNGSNLINYLSSIIFLNKKNYIPLINGDFSKKDIKYLKKKKVKFLIHSNLSLSKVLFYQLSIKLSKFVISEYGGGTCLPFVLKKKMLLLNFFPITHGYPNSLIFPKIYLNKKNKIKKINELFEKKGFEEFIKDNEFRKLNNFEIYKATKEFYNNFLFKNKIRKNEITKMKCNFSNYFKTSKYSETYLKIQKGLF